jgi:hypothetical protein
MVIIVFNLIFLGQGLTQKSVIFFFGPAGGKVKLFFIMLIFAIAIAKISILIKK